MNNIHTSYYHYNNKLALAENVSIEPKYLKMPQSRQNKGYRCPCGFSQIRCLVYILGLGFSLWQTAVCLEKYLQFVRSTQVSMKKSTNTYLPALGNYCNYCFRTLFLLYYILTSLFQLFVHHLGLGLTHNFLKASTLQMRITRKEAGSEIILLIRLTQRLK